MYVALCIAHLTSISSGSACTYISGYCWNRSGRLFFKCFLYKTSFMGIGPGGIFNMVRLP